MLDSPHIRKLLTLALEEDLPTGDVTTESIGGLAINSQAILYAKQDCVACGLPLVVLISEMVCEELRVECHIPDGDKVLVGEKLLSIKGPLSSILKVERTALNMIQHLSGIATHVERLVKRAGGLKLLDTRKTLPAYRALEKYAVEVGGGENHRFSLSDQILIKDNHADGSGVSTAELVARAKLNRPEGCLLEVEVRTVEELPSVVAAGPDIILLDNMDEEHLKKSIVLIRNENPQIQIEISGNITEERFSELQQFISPNPEHPSLRVSMGALTYGAKRVDLSLAIDKNTK